MGQIQVCQKGGWGDGDCRCQTPCQPIRTQIQALQRRQKGKNGFQCQNLLSSRQAMVGQGQFRQYAVSASDAFPAAYRSLAQPVCVVCPIQCIPSSKQHGQNISSPQQLVIHGHLALQQPPNGRCLWHTRRWEPRRGILEQKTGKIIEPLNLFNRQSSHQTRLTTQTLDGWLYRYGMGGIRVHVDVVGTQKFPRDGLVGRETIRVFVMGDV
mmetsp:Transcript_31888/g.73255  ORF Transcript_31888/g.73255 Transcript_31888/m.73255 type:complete len:211 (+) Transcript_31888:675-1307(+)